MAKNEHLTEIYELSQYFIGYPRLSPMAWNHVYSTVKKKSSFYRAKTLVEFNAKSADFGQENVHISTTNRFFFKMFTPF